MRAFNGDEISQEWVEYLASQTRQNVFSLAVVARNGGQFANEICSHRIATGKSQPCPGSLPKGREMMRKILFQWKGCKLFFWCPNRFTLQYTGVCPHQMLTPSPGLQLSIDSSPTLLRGGPDYRISVRRWFYLSRCYLFPSKMKLVSIINIFRRNEQHLYSRLFLPIQQFLHPCIYQESHHPHQLDFNYIFSLLYHINGFVSKPQNPGKYFDKEFLFYLNWAFLNLNIFFNSKYS